MTLGIPKRPGSYRTERLVSLLEKRELKVLLQERGAMWREWRDFHYAFARASVIRALLLAVATTTAWFTTPPGALQVAVAFVGWFAIGMATSIVITQLRQVKVCVRAQAVETALYTKLMADPSRCDLVIEELKKL